MVDIVPQVEDTKGNTGETGCLMITNLRLIWYTEQNNKINLSVGFDCILNAEVSETQSAVKGTGVTLLLRTRYQQSRYEFIFSALIATSTKIFDCFQAVIKSYEQTKVYRDLKLRCSVVQERRLNFLPKEELFSTYNGVWNLAAEQGSLGTLIITNVRIVWFA